MIAADNIDIKRRTLLKAGAGLAVSLFAPGAGACLFSDSPFPVIDTHIHFSNPARQGTSNTPPPTPEDYRRMVEPCGVRGAIVVEASPWMEDNQWVLDLAAQNKIIVGYLGHLEPGTPQFREQLLRFRKNPVFRGIRYGNFWGWDLGKALQRPEVVSDIRLLADAGLAFDASLDIPGSVPGLNPVIRLTDSVPDLRVVIDHLPFYFKDSGKSEYMAALRELQDRPQVYAKLSGILHKVDDRAPVDVNFYRPALDELWDIFGSDRLIYGSDWPPCEKLAPYKEVFRVAHEYFATKGESAGRKFFRDNSVRAYQYSQ